MKLLLTTIRTDNKYTEYALRSLCSVVEDAPLEVEMKFYGKYDLDIRIYEDIIRGNYNIVYFHCDEFNEPAISRIIEMIKKAAPSTAVIVGGMQVSFETGYYMRSNPWVDYVIRGEGETVLYNFLKSVLEFEFDFENIGGLAYRNGDSIAINDFDEPAELEDLPFIYDRAEPEGSVIYYETVRGCSDRSTHRQFLPDPRMRSLSLARITRELRYFLVKAPDKVVVFDRYFNYSPERAYRIFEYLISNDNGTTSFEFNISGENLDDETVRLLSEAREGLFVFNIDVASTNAEVLSAIGRTENIYQLMYNATKLLRPGKVEARFSISAGLPHETQEMFARSFNKTYGLCEGHPLRVENVRLQKGSLLRYDAGRLGYEATFRTPYDVLSTDAMTAAELIRVRQVADVAGAYIGDGSFRAAFPRMMNDTGIKPYDLFSKLTDYVYEHGYENRLGKKEQLARYLYGLAAELYESFDDTLKLDILKDAIHADLEAALPEEALIRFERDGWDIEG